MSHFEKHVERVKELKPFTMVSFTLSQQKKMLWTS